ncbi:integral membrane protein S linking to the trans Golgi network-domain-containing protein, partial [Blastocladiella britannica]
MAPPRPATSGSFRSSTFDPRLLAAQITCMQAAFYLVATLLALLVALLTRSHASLAMVLDPEALRPGIPGAWPLFFATLVNAVAMSFVMVPIVTRARLALDFSCTLHALHLVVCTLHSRGALPVSAMWWAAQLSALLITSTLGEKLCLEREMEPIAVGSGVSSRSRATGSDSSAETGAARGPVGSATGKAGAATVGSLRGSRSLGSIGAMAAAAVGSSAGTSAAKKKGSPTASTIGLTSGDGDAWPLQSLGWSASGSVAGSSSNGGGGGISGSASGLGATVAMRAFVGDAGNGSMGSLPSDRKNV